MTQIMKLSIWKSYQDLELKGAICAIHIGHLSLPSDTQIHPFITIVILCYSKRLVIFREKNNFRLDI